MKQGKNAIFGKKSPYPPIDPKKSFILILLLFLFNYLFHYFSAGLEKREVASVEGIDDTPKNWTAHRHTEKGMANELPSILKLKKFDLYKKEKKILEEKKFAEFEGRKIMGEDYILKTKTPEITVFLNEKSDDWTEKTASEILRFHDDDTELFIEHKKELIILGPKGARYVEQAVLTFVGPNKRKGFSALIDSQTGKIIQAWGGDITENYGKRRGSRSPSAEAE